MVEIVHWNPKQKKNILGYSIPLPFLGRKNNFGDLIGPMIVKRVLENNNYDFFSGCKNRRLLTVGSILHFAKNDDVIWGSGINGKVFKESDYNFNSLDVRSLRGPLTRDFLVKKGIFCPEVFGDPGMLFSSVFPEYIKMEADFQYDITIIPNLNDYDGYRGYSDVVNPQGNFDNIIKRIARSKFVTGSSLHAIVIAESFGVPARLIESKHEKKFKYEDYYLGTCQRSFKAAKSISNAIDLGGEKDLSKSDRDKCCKDLLDNFPFDLWGGKL